MQKKIQIFLEKNHMIEESDHIVVGFSGGADSLCLLLILKELQEALHFSLTAVHVEHGIRGAESLQDAAFAQHFCEQENIPFLTYTVQALQTAQEEHLTLEEAARKLRYACFENACERLGANKIAVAHHGDDCAETILFHLSRGTGIRGLCGIVPVQGRIIRPLLCVTRAEIEQYLQERQQAYCTDSTNLDTTYARNRIRRNVLPQLEEINPRTVSHMVRTAGYLEEICAYLEEASREAGKTGIIHSYEDGQLQEIHVDQKHFLQMHPVLQKHFLHQLLGDVAGSRKDITAQHIDAVRGLFSAQVGRTIVLPYQLEAQKTYDAVRIYRKKDSGQLQGEDREAAAIALRPGDTVWVEQLRIEAKIQLFHGKQEEIPQKTYTKWFDYDKIKDAVLLRKRRPGDYLQVRASGGHKKLKDFFIDEKIPREQRDDIWLLADGSHILWVIGWRISEAYKVTQKTKHILAVCVDGGKENE